ncbi:hypothetical protein [Nocardioides sp. R-C-SC26]|uniref:hypothetical protein n=1 Tax=Nocardioides sp. R-C-SC26 TaxID=2870414 RepID=UPI001E32BDC5|nr:hypothetical protein [Nocardioides sp. R-C-SC26]
MTLPDLPPTFRRPAEAERPWAWTFSDAAGEPVVVEGELAEQRFTHQGDAESWIGEIWRDLVDAGVAQVHLVEHERVVYGPMSLSV